MFSRIDPKELDQNVFSMIGEQWMLVTAGTAERCNTMTASWGGLGVLWGKPVATVYIRPQRYTLEFVEREDCFTLSFFGEEYRKALALCGSKSGRDVDKVKECGFTVAGADIPANNRLFDTLDTTTRTLEISDTCTVLLSDTVGFIRKLPHHLVEAFKATLEELSYADLLLHVIDASNPLWREQAAVVEQLIVELGAEQTPRIDVFNKCDRFTGDILPHGADIVSISAKTGQGLDELLKKIGGRLDTGACRVVLRLPYDQGGVVDMLHRQAKVERVDYGEAIEVEAVCTPVQLGRLKDYIVSGWTPPKEPWED